MHGDHRVKRLKLHRDGVHLATSRADGSTTARRVQPLAAPHGVFSANRSWLYDVASPACGGSAGGAKRVPGLTLEHWRKLLAEGAASVCTAHQREQKLLQGDLK